MKRERMIRLENVPQMGVVDWICTQIGPVTIWYENGNGLSFP